MGKECFMQGRLVNTCTGRLSPVRPSPQPWQNEQKGNCIKNILGSM